MNAKESHFNLFYVSGIWARLPAGEVLPGVFSCETLLYIRGEILQGTTVKDLDFTLSVFTYEKKIAKIKKLKLCRWNKDTRGLL